MADSAKVLSVDALKQFRIALITFVEEARNALGGVDMELRRTRDWIERDQLSYWQTQVKRRHERMMNARTELFRRQISQQGSEAKSDTEQKEALREAQRRLRVAEEKVEIVKRLIPFFHHAMAEYVSHATPLADHLSGGLERSLATLQRMITSIEEYLAIAPPTAPRPGSPGEEAAPRMTSARAGGSAAETGTPSAAEGGEEPGHDEDATGPGAPGGKRDPGPAVTVDTLSERGHDA
jgi:hypothetical protein